MLLFSELSSFSDEDFGGSELECSSFIVSGKTSSPLLLFALGLLGKSFNL